MKPRRRWLLAAAVLMLATACGDSGSTPEAQSTPSESVPNVAGAPLDDAPAAAGVGEERGACGEWGSMSKGRGEVVTMCFGAFRYVSTFVAPGDDSPVFKVRTPEETREAPFVAVEGESRAELDLSSLGFAERAWAVFAKFSCPTRNECTFDMGGVPVPSEEIEVDETLGRASINYTAFKGCRVKADLAGKGQAELGPLPDLDAVLNDAVQPEDQGIAGFVYAPVGVSRAARASGAGDACGVPLAKGKAAAGLIFRDVGAGAGYYVPKPEA